MKFARLAVAVLLLTGLGACTAQPSADLFPATVTPTITFTPTTTPVWFPVTETPTPIPLPTQQPTEDYRPGLGPTLLTDPFSNRSFWSTLQDESGRVTYGNNELTISIASPGGSLFSLKNGVLPGESYIEINAEASLCRGKDVYGVLVRAQSSRDYYRLLATCDGSLRMERIKNSEVVIMQDWVPSAQLPDGGLLGVKFGIWGVGKELRVFVNDSYQFTVRDPVFESGQVGVYARSAADTPLSVSFSNLIVSGIDKSRLPTTTPQPSATP